MLIRADTIDYDIMRAKPNGTVSCRIRVREPGRYYLIPIPYGETVRTIDDNILVRSNSIFRRESVDHNYINLPYEYMNADILFFNAEEHHVYIRSSFDNYIIKKAFDTNGNARIDLPLEYRENVLTSFMLNADEFNPEEEQLVDWVQIKETTDLRRYVNIYLPAEAIGRYIVSFEDELYEY